MNSLNSITSQNNLNQIKKLTSQFRIITTQTCNEACFFCHNEGLPVKKHFLTKENFEKIIKAIKELELPQKIRFTWGEPLLHPDIYTFITLTKKQLPKTNLWLTTNGLLIKEQLLQILATDLDSLTISLHSFNQQDYKTITKVDGLQQVLEWIELIHKDFKWQIKINSVIWKNNINEIEKLIEYTQQKNIQLKLLDILEHNNKQLIETLDQQITIDKLQNFLPDHILPYIKAQRTQPKCYKCIYKTQCWHEASYLRITPDLELRPCLSNRKFDIQGKNLSYEKFKKALILGLYRTHKLDK